MRRPTSNQFRTLLLTVSLSLTVISSAVYAQPQPADVFTPTSSWVDQGDQRHYEIVKMRYAAELNNDEWYTVFEELGEEFRNTATDWSGHPDVRDKLLNEFHRLTLNFRNGVGRLTTTAGRQTLTVLSAQETGQFQADVSRGIIIYFSGRSNEIRLCPEVPPNETPIPPCQGQPQLTEEQAEDIRYRAETANRLLNDFNSDQRDVVVDVITTSHSRWNNYLENGYSMFPWEGLFNSWLLRYDIKNPPGNQWIIAHPGVGVEIPVNGITDAGELTAKEVLVVEVIGNIWYTGSSYEQYYGLSAISTLREDIGLGVGGMVHLSRAMRLGLTWHVSEEPGKTFIKDPFLTFSFDLFGLFKSKREVVKRFLD